METKIDARGMACPKPVILTKKAMDNGRKGEEICVLVDNTIAVENLRKLAASQKADYKFRKREKRNMKLSLPYSRKRMKPRYRKPWNWKTAV